MTEIIDGKKIARKIIEKVKRDVLKDGLNLKLSVILVGNDPISVSYILQKKKACYETGIDFSLFNFPLSIKKESLIEDVFEISKESSALIIQLPLPHKLDTYHLFDAIDVDKDVALLSSRAIGRYYSGDFSIIPPTVSAISEILKGEDLVGKNVVVIGSGRLVGRPVTHWISSQKATVTTLNSSTYDIKSFTKKADIVISGVGKSGLVRRDMIKKGSIIIDAGSASEDNLIKGDVVLKNVIGKASKVSPVPGGVGPITTACLLRNIIELKKIYG